MNQVTASNITDFLAILAALQNQAPLWWYRGQADASWSLKPSIARRGNAETTDLEVALTKKFRQNAVALLPRPPATEHEWLFLMQHHRLPTRLLDWSESPLVALYFAVEDVKSSAECVVWCLNPVSLNKLGHLETPLGDIPSFSSEDILENYLPSKVAAERMSKLNPLACIGPRNSARMYAQQGVFTITHRVATAIDSMENVELTKISFPEASLASLRAELKVLGVNRLSLFPDLDSVADLAKGTLA